MSNGEQKHVDGNKKNEAKVNQIKKLTDEASGVKNNEDMVARHPKAAKGL